MKHRFKEKCDICGCWKSEYQSYKKKMIVCDGCMKKNGGRFELDEPEQLSIYDEIGDDKNE